MNRLFSLRTVPFLVAAPLLYVSLCNLVFCAKRDLRDVHILSDRSAAERPRHETRSPQVRSPLGRVPNLKVMSYNLNHVSRGNDNVPWNDPYYPPGSTEWQKIALNIRSLLKNPLKVEQNLRQIVAVIRREDPDIVFLQEADRGVIESYNRDTPLEIVEGAGYPYAIWGAKWSMDLGIRHVTGNAILSKYPIVAAENVPLNAVDGMYSYRRLFGAHTALVATIQAGDQRIRLVNTHLFSKKHGYEKKEEQVSNLLGMVADSPHPVIFGGDINSSIKRLKGNRASANDPALPLLYFSGLVCHNGFFDEDTLDYIFIKPGDPTRYLEQYKLPPVATDHPIIVSRIDLTTSPAAAQRDTKPGPASVFFANRTS